MELHCKPCKETNFLLEEHLKDPSQFLDCRHNCKRNPKPPDFRHKQTGKCPRIHARYNSPYILKLNNRDGKDMPNEQIWNHTEVMNMLKLCQKKKDIRKTKEIHAYVLERSSIYTKDAYIASTLITTYAKCGAMEKAGEVFEQLPVRNIVTWNALITGYAQNGLGNEALQCFQNMRDSGISPDVVTFVCILKACGIVRSLETGQDVDAEIRKQGLVEKNVVVGNALMNMYFRCGAIEKAREVFEHLHVRDVVSWSTLIAGYTNHGFSDEALKYFKQMKDAGVCPDAKAYACILKACAISGSLVIGEDIDAEVRERGLLIKDVVLVTALMNMYCKCGALDKAREVFKHIPVQNVVSWNALITGYVQHGLGEEALKCFQQMQDVGIHPNEVTYICILKACGIAGSLLIGEGICAKVRKQGLLQKATTLGTALVDMYSKCGAIEKAREVFEELPMRNVVTWSALIAGYAQCGSGDEALKCFEQMQDAGVHPNSITYISVLKACGIVGFVGIGQDIHAAIRRKGGLFHKDNILLGTALVDMYSKCGAFEKAREVFKELPVRDIVPWSALLTGYSQLGKENVVFNLYNRMKAEGIVPDLVIFVALLTTCSHAGLVKEGEKLFDEMCGAFHLVPTQEHYTCMVDLCCRAGHFDKVRDLIEKVPPPDRLPLLTTILGACRKWRNVNLGKWAFEQSIQLSGNCAALYVCMEHVYAGAAMQIEVDGEE